MKRKVNKGKVRTKQDKVNEKESSDVPSTVREPDREPDTSPDKDNRFRQQGSADSETPVFRMRGN